MNLKNLLKELLPPLVIKLIRRSSYPKLKYRSYEEASLACRNNAYEEISFATMVIDKNLLFKKKLDSSPVFDLSTLRTLIPLVCIKAANDRIRVVDFGGGGGYHFTVAKKALGNDKSIDWFVVETPSMSNEAQKFANHQLRFFSDIDSAVNGDGNFDLVFTSSALQYCPEPFVHLERLLDINAQYVYITRTPFIESLDQIITTQSSKLSDNGPGPLPAKFKDRLITYPITYISKKRVEDLLNQKYDIRFKIEEEGEVFGFDRRVIKTTGYFCVRKSAK